MDHKHICFSNKLFDSSSLRSLCSAISTMKLLLLLSALSMAFTPSHTTEFAYNGFSPSPDFTLDGLAHITPAGLIQLTNDTTFTTAHVFYSRPVNFKNSSSFSTSFAFAMVPLFATKGGHGMAFVISPAKNLPGGAAGQFMGLMNDTTNGNSTNHIFAVEFDVIQTRKFHDLSDDHVGIDVNGMVSAAARMPGYIDQNDAFQNLTLLSGNPILAWIDYSSSDKEINVTLAPFGVPKPRTPLLTLSYDVSSVFDTEMYVGFSAATGPELTSNFYVLGWSFSTAGIAPELDVSELPKVPRLGRKKKPAFLTSGLPVICVVLVVILGLAVVKVVQRKRKFEDVVEDWEHVYGSHRFKYKDLCLATKGFREREILGIIGGLGIVYRGVLPETQLQVAIKRVYYESREGVQEFVSEAVTAGRLRHRNLVPFLGYCWRKSELFLVYEYMPNGSLDVFLYHKPNNTLNWAQRFAVIKGIAAAALYLHEEWDQLTIHREINAGNIFLDGEFNGKIGGFSLARLYDQRRRKRRRVVGTLGYLAPELARSSKATKSSDVYAFGALMLEMACGKMPLEPRNMADEDFILVDWVFSRWIKGDIVQAVDPNMGNGYAKSEVEMVLKLGLLCTHSESRARPSMRRVVQYLGGGLELPELSSTNFRIMA